MFLTNSSRTFPHIENAFTASIDNWYYGKDDFDSKNRPVWICDTKQVLDAKNSSPPFSMTALADFMANTLPLASFRARLSDFCAPSSTIYSIPLAVPMGTTQSSAVCWLSILASITSVHFCICLITPLIPTASTIWYVYETTGGKRDGDEEQLQKLAVFLRSSASASIYAYALFVVTWTVKNLSSTSSSWSTTPSNIDGVPSTNKVTTSLTPKYFGKVIADNCWAVVTLIYRCKIKPTCSATL